MRKGVDTQNRLTNASWKAGENSNRNYMRGGNAMSKDTETLKMTVMHIYRSEDKASRQLNLNRKMEIVIIRHLEKYKLISK